MALAESWHIRSRARICSLSERPFEDGETIVTALFADPESSGYLRKDFGFKEWKARDEAATGRPFSFWKAVYQAPVAAEKDDAMKRLSPEDLLRKLVDDDEDHTENARYILAVMLERKKILRETDTQRTPTGILRVYEHRKMGDIFIVKDPDIPLSEVESVQEEVMVLLDQSTKPPQPEAEAESVPTEGEAVAVPEDEGSGAGPSAEDEGKIEEEEPSEIETTSEEPAAIADTAPGEEPEADEEEAKPADSTS